MENQTIFREKNNQTDKQDLKSLSIPSQKQPQKPQRKTITILSLLLTSIFILLIFVYAYQKQKPKYCHDLTNTPSSPTPTLQTQITSEPESINSSLSICQNKNLPNISFIKSLDNKNEIWTISNNQKTLQTTWGVNQKQDLSQQWVAESPKELTINDQSYPVNGYTSLYQNNSQKTPIYQTTQNQAIETIISPSKDQPGVNPIYFSVIQGKPTTDSNYQMDIYQYNLDTNQNSSIASFNSKDNFNNEKPGFSSVTAGGRFIVTTQTPLISGRGGCGANMAKFYDLNTQQFLTTITPGKIDCGNEYIFKPDSSEYILVTGPVLIMNNPPQNSTIKIYRGKFENNSMTPQQNIIREFPINQYGAIYEIYEVDFDEETLYVKASNPNIENSLSSIIKIPFNQSKSIEKVFDFQGFNYNIQAKTFSSKQQFLISNLFLNKQGSIQNYQVNNWAGGALVAFYYNDNCWQEIDRVERNTMNNYWEGYPEVKFN